MYFGLYGSDCASNINNFRTITPYPDDIWWANYNSSSGTSAFGAPQCISSANWVNHQRVHQFRGTHNETHGGITISVDNDCADARVDNDPLDPGIIC